ncbi:hypothetical protein GUJ93_ZPchr0005g16129 [Zizania palustris]|uniref:RPA-interacting protein N-terminal domain-containing protein n=1 Tax=Zizania palustris TaxID=103762 RepID=A0A8J5VFZ5_ZIZPA|nr:hypothetical protein GUJ93_ZPchr0005g16129 [Zizania palustris]
MDPARSRTGRVPVKSRRPDWREELRINCLKRVKEERVHLLWKNRTHGPLPANDTIKMESAVRDIIFDELEKLKQYGDGKEDQEADMIWEYHGPHATKPVETANEDILLEMERLLYEDLREESIRKELEALDEEDAYLAQAVFDHMELNDKETNAKLWCPVCKQGELRETYNLIYCTLCKLRLDLGEDKINLEFLRESVKNAPLLML